MFVEEDKDEEIELEQSGWLEQAVNPGIIGGLYGSGAYSDTAGSSQLRMQTGSTIDTIISNMISTFRTPHSLHQI